MFKKASLKKTFIGIDIGSYAIKVLDVLSEQDKITLTALAIKDLPQDASEENFQDTLKQTLQGANLSSKNVRFALSGPNVAVRFISMPRMSKEDLKKALKFEADKYIPYNADEVVIDSSILGTPQEENQQMRVLLAAAKKDVIAKRIDLFKQLGFNITLIDVEAFAILNAFMSSMKELDKEKSIALINLGHQYTNIVVAKGESPYFSRDIQIGGSQIDRAISRQLNIKEKEARDLKLNPEDRTSEVAEIIKGVLNSITDEIRLSFGYYENQYGKAIDQIYISGGSVGLNELGNFFEENLGLKPQTWDPIDNFILDKGLDKELLDKARPSLAVSAGLVIRKDT